MWSIAGLTRNASFSTRFVSWKDCSNKDSSVVFPGGSFWNDASTRDEGDEDALERTRTRRCEDGRDGRGRRRLRRTRQEVEKRRREGDDVATWTRRAFGVRETLEYLMDSNAFVEKRVAKYGPVFKTAFFFKPTIAFGSKEAVEEFKSFEAEFTGR